MSISTGFHHYVLMSRLLLQMSTLAQVVRLEAELAESIPVSKLALNMLWEVAAQQDPSRRPGNDGAIAERLIKAIAGRCNPDL